jgi:hypothetical protein
MHANEWRGFSMEFSAHESDSFIKGTAAFESINREAAVARGQSGLRDKFYAGAFFEPAFVRI